MTEFLNRKQGPTIRISLAKSGAKILGKSARRKHLIRLLIKSGCYETAKEHWPDYCWDKWTRRMTKRVTSVVTTYP